jgi:hypothetical protein
MATSIQAHDVITMVASKTGLDAAATENAVGTIFSIISHEAEGTTVSQLFAKIPGASDLATRYDVMAAPAAGGGASGGGIMGMVTGLFGGLLGARAQAVINGIAHLESSGLTMAQIEAVGATLLAEIKGAGGHDLVKQIMASVPALAGYMNTRAAA